MEKSLQERIAELEAAIESLEQRRFAMGDAAVEPELAPLREQLTRLRSYQNVVVLQAGLADPNAPTIDLLEARLKSIIAAQQGQFQAGSGNNWTAQWEPASSLIEAPQQAIRTGLAILAAGQETALAGQASQSTLQIGLHSGPPQEAAAITQVAGLLQQAALADTMLISAPLADLVRGRFDLQPRFPPSIADSNVDKPIYQVQPWTFRRPIHRVEGEETPLLGRDEELQHLQEAFQALWEEGRCWIVTIVGEAGLGKSRLLDEFDLWAERSPRPYLKFRAQPGGAYLPYALLRNLFAYAHHIRESDPPELARHKLARGIAGPIQEVDAMEYVHLIGHLLGFQTGLGPQPTSPLDETDRLRDQALLAISDYWQALSTQQPLLILLEDLHRADESSLQAIKRLAEGLADRPILVVCTARPAFLQRDPHWEQAGETTQALLRTAQGSPWYSRLDLSPLTDQDSRHLFESRLNALNRPGEDKITAILAQARGNPLYLEEIARLIVEQGTSPQPIPPSLEEVVQARFDHLPADQQDVLQRAAVLGLTFWSQVLEFPGQEHAPVDSVLAALEQRDLIRRQEGSILRGQTEYVFKHGQIRQAAWQALSPELARRYHTRAARWLMEQNEERANTYAGLWAEHMDQARQPGLAAKYLSQAGEQAARVYAFREAQIFLERALASLPRQSSARIPLLMQAGNALYRLRNYAGARRRLEESLALARQADRSDEIIEVLFLLGLIAREQGDFDESRQWLEEGLKLNRQLGRRAGEAQNLLDLGWLEYRLGNYEQARSYLDQGLAVSQEIGDQGLLALAYNGLATVATREHAPEAAHKFLLQSLELYRGLGDHRGTAAVLNNLGVLAWSQQDYPTARDYYEQALDLFEKLHHPQNTANTLANLGLVAVVQEDYDRAKSYFYRALRGATAGRVTPIVLESLGGLASILARTGRMERALEFLGLVLQHPSLRIDTKLNLQPTLDYLHEQLSSAEIEAALARGQGQRLEEVAGQVLSQGLD
ncbi:MAG: tetratricopeptide repeat protein [Chloroflexia bacterium]|nr:tetratricopeptide repeat protein [Chloroflexia bacterium]